MNEKFALLLFLTELHTLFEVVHLLWNWQILVKFAHVRLKTTVHLTFPLNFEDATS